jgi:hypothetical protein
MLELRRLHADLIMLYKILNGCTYVNLKNCISVSTIHSTRGNKLKLYKYHAKLDVRKYFFAVRTINVWNSLPDSIINCTNVNIFVNKLKSFNFLDLLKGHACQ